MKLCATSHMLRRTCRENSSRLTWKKRRMVDVIEREEIVCFLDFLCCADILAISSSARRLQDIVREIDKSNSKQPDDLGAKYLLSLVDSLLFTCSLAVMQRCSAQHGTRVMEKLLQGVWRWTEW